MLWTPRCSDVQEASAPSLLYETEYIKQNCACSFFLFVFRVSPSLSPTNPANWWVFLLASIFAGSEVNKNGEQPHSCRSLLSISHLWKTKTVYALARFFILINKTLWSPTGWKHSFEYFLRQYLFCFMSTAAKHATVVVPRRCPLASTMSSFVRLNVILIALKCKTFWKQNSLSTVVSTCVQQLPAQSLNALTATLWFLVHVWLTDLCCKSIRTPTPNH